MSVMQTKFSDGTFGVCGILPRDAEFKTVGSKNTSLCTFSVKIGERNTGGEKPEAAWCSCVCWGQLAEDVKSLRKMDTVFAVGRIEKRDYEAKDGTTKQKTELICEAVFRGMLPAPASAPSPSVPTKPDAMSPQTLDAADPYSDDGDLPF